MKTENRRLKIQKPLLSIILPIKQKLILQKKKTLKSPSNAKKVFFYFVIKNLRKLRNKTTSNTNILLPKTLKIIRVI